MDKAYKYEINKMIQVYRDSYHLEDKCDRYKAIHMLPRVDYPRNIYQCPPHKISISQGSKKFE